MEPAAQAGGGGPALAGPRPLGPAPLALDSSVALVVIPSKARFYIVAKSSTRRHVQIIKIDPVSGALKFTQTYGRDMFPTEAQAFEFLKHEGSLEILGTGRHTLGYVVIGHTGLLLLVEKARVAATLPGNHQVKTVVTSKWHKIPLQSPQLIAMAGGQSPIDPESILSQQQRDEYNRGVDKITTFPIDGAHYFCETIDLTRPFPSYRPATQPSWEFVWNKWLTVAFRNVGLDFLCPALMQGLCEERPLLDYDGAPYSVALISRRGRLHVGPRYKARGLNDYAEPANEIEVEQVIWRKPAREGQPINWSRYTWRRGSVPLWWGVHMKNNGLGEAEIKIKEQRTFKGSRRYVRRLQKRYCPVAVLDPEDHPTGSSGTTPTGQQGSGDHIGTPRSTAASSCGSVASSLAAGAAHDPSLAVPLVFVSLLRKGTPDRDRSEAKLAAAFDFMCNAIKKEHKIPLQYIALDWHELDKQLGSHELVSAFWNTMKDILPQHRFALGTLSKVTPDHYDLARSGMEPSPNEPSGLPSERCLSGAGLGWQAKWFRQQRGVARYNCADSLDRTNVGSFFGAVQVLVEQCRELDIAVAVGPRGMGSIVNAIKRQQVAAAVGAGSGGMGAGGGSRTAVPTPRTLATISQRGSTTNVAGAGLTQGPGATLANGMQGLSQGLDKLGKLFTDFKSPKTSNAAVEPSSASYTDLSSMSAPWPGTAGSAPPRSSTPVATHPHHNQNGLGGGSPMQPRPSSPAFNAPGALDEIARSLPHGWEVKIDNASERLFYVDHNSRTTHWSHPSLSKEAVEELGRNGTNAHLEKVAGNGNWAAGSASPPVGTMTPGGRMQYGRNTTDCVDLVAATEKLRLAEEERELCEPLSPWCMLKSSAKAFARRINPEALSALAELFLVNGDMSAWLYTGSQAMHSERILLFEPENSKLRKAGVGAYGNIMVGIKRRYNNVMMDTERQQQIEVFLGMKHAVYFPMTKLYYKEDAIVPLDFQETDDESDSVGHIDWAPADRSVHSGVAAGSYAADAMAQLQAGGHNRHRNKSYSSVDLLWDKGALNVIRGTPGARPGLAAAGGSERPLPSSVDRTAGGCLATGAGFGAGAVGGEDPHGHMLMHKAVSDPSMLNLLGLEVNDMSNASSLRQNSTSGSTLLPEGTIVAMPRSVSMDNLQVASSTQQAASGSRFSSTGAPPLLPTHYEPQGPQQHAHSARMPQLQGLAAGEMHHSASAGGLAGLHHTASADCMPLHNRQLSGTSVSSGGGTPEREHAQPRQSARMVGSAIKQGLKKFAEPLGLL